MAHVVALTGGIASGKSTVAKLLADAGCLIIDTDAISRDVVRPGTPGYAAVLAQFGHHLALSTEGLDRPKLARIVFGSEGARRRLEAIVHPLVRKEAARQTDLASADSLVVQMIPLLVETGQPERFEAVLVVDAPKELQVARIAARDGLDAAAAERRISAQASREQRLAAADFVIANTESLDELAAQVSQILADLRLQLGLATD